MFVIRVLCKRLAVEHVSNRCTSVEGRNGEIKSVEGLLKYNDFQERVLRASCTLLQLWQCVELGEQRQICAKSYHLDNGLA